MRCAGEFIFRRIDPEGNLMYWGVCEKSHNLGNCLREDFGKMLLRTSPILCDFCWCAERVEPNQAFWGDLEAIKNFIRQKSKSILREVKLLSATQMLPQKGS